MADEMLAAVCKTTEGASAMTIHGWENLGMKVYGIAVLIIILIFGVVAYLAEKNPEKM